MRLLRVLLTGLAGVLAASVGYSAQDQIYRIGDGVTAPVLEEEVKPEYTAAALAAGVEGIVGLECVVRADGTVGEGRVVAPLHPDLDREALLTLAQWRFKPGTKDGKPVAVRVEVEMSFALREEPPPRRGPPLGSPEVYKPGNGVTHPVLVRDIKPMYSPEAMRARVQGTVHLECVVLPDGTVGDVRVTKRLHQDQDAEALRTVRRWMFKPGTKDGAPVPVQVEIMMTFTLR